MSNNFIDSRPTNAGVESSSITSVLSTATKQLTNVVSDFRHYKHEWVKIDKSQPNSVQVKKPSLPTNLTCFFCKRKGHHWPKDCPRKNKKQKGHDDTKESEEGVCPQTGILVIGNTGTGKSSIIKLLSGVDTKISHGAERGTDKTSIITSKYNENLHFIDSVGLQDQDIRWKDSNTLKKTLKYLHFAKLDSLKIIFCIAGDTSTRQGLFAQIARFIGILKVNTAHDEYKLDENIQNEENQNVWNSVLIVKKGTFQGIGSEKISEFSGVFAAAKTNGAPKQFETAKHIFGFTCYEWNLSAQQNDVFRMLTEERYEDFGYYSAQSAKRIIENKLKGLSSFKLKFRHEQCVKCGVNGDSRYITAPCHTKLDYFHDEPLEAKHTGKEEYIHSGYLIDCNVLTGKKRHMSFGRKTAVHQPPFATVKYHAGPIKKLHKKRVLAGILTWGRSELKWKNKDWCLCVACNKYTYNKECIRKYECCGGKEENEQCSKEANRKWSCCGKPWDSNGCKDVTEKGQIYTCCGKQKGSEGHDLIYSCCKQAGDGCKFYYPCCNKGPQSKGCKRKCVNCREDWRNGPGCVEAE